MMFYDCLLSISGFVISSLRAPPSGIRTLFVLASGTGNEANVVLSANSCLMVRDFLFLVWPNESNGFKYCWSFSSAGIGHDSVKPPSIASQSTDSCSASSSCFCLATVFFLSARFFLQIKKAMMPIISRPYIRKCQYSYTWSWLHSKHTPSEPPTAPPTVEPLSLPGLGVCEAVSLSPVAEVGSSAAVNNCWDVSIKLTFLGSVTLTASTVLKVFAKDLSSWYPNKMYTILLDSSKTAVNAYNARLIRNYQ